MFREVLAKLEAQRDGLAAAIDVLRPYADAETTIVVTVEPAVDSRAPRRKARQRWHDNRCPAVDGGA